MDAVDECDKLSKDLLIQAKTAVEDITEQLMNAEKEFDGSSETTDPHVVNNDTTKQDKQSVGGQHLSHKPPITHHEAAFREKLVGFDTRSSTPKQNTVVLQKTERQPRQATKCVMKQLTNDSEKSTDASAGIWSLDSKPVQFAASQDDTSTVDFHLVEAVLPKSRRSLHDHLVKDTAATDDDELSDGSQSHSVFTIAKLVSSLNAEKKKSKDLEEQVLYLKNEIEAKKIEQELNEAKRKEADTSHVASLVEEIYTAQKERESAVLARLKLATQERDEAILRAKAYAKDARLSSHDVNNNNAAMQEKSLQVLLNAVCEAETGRAAEKYSRDIISRIGVMKKERDRITCEEMKAVIRERDSAQYMCRSLHRELKILKEKRAKNDDSFQLEENQKLKEQLRQTEDERDDVIAKLTATKEEMETLRVYYSLHKKLVESGRLANMNSDQDDATRLAQVLRVAHEHNHVQETNARRHETEACRLREKNERLDRLVTVLRKKLALLAQKSAQSVMDASSNSSREIY
uniref:Mirror-image polydactyly gene 1 protein-like n=1 Tax=Phallusia mammillata TaxID=59560 RepID=A0A6F9DL37_9ASCI|nr:mirror-image polydactyly gene 1 protein-like [Phallusia mammillata]